MTRVERAGRRGALLAAVVIAGALVPIAASAVPISADSELAMFGTFTPIGGATLDVATGLSFPSPVTIALAAGDFSTGPALFSSFDFNPASTGTIFTFGAGGEFSADSIVVDFQTATALDLTLLGTFSLAGFDDVAGEVILTADAQGGLYTFSASGTVIPEPTTIMLLGLGLAGLASARRNA
jgi:PEP-CTERM motif